MRTSWILLMFALLVSGPGCASKKIITQPVERQEQIFPYGVYQQKVTLILPEDAKGSGFSGREIQFSGVVQLRPELIRVVILSQFSTTVAKIEEDLNTNELKMEIYAEQMKKHESKVRDYYSVMKRVLLVRKRRSQDLEDGIRLLRSDPLDRPLEMETGDRNVNFRFSDYDANGIPERMSIEQKKFRVEIEVSGYEI